MWTCSADPLSDDRAIRYVPLRDGERLTYADVIQGLRVDSGFRATLNQWLADAPFASFRWETPPVTAATVGRTFEFVLFDAPRLSQRADPKPFAEPFRSHPDDDVVDFPNLGGDSVLVVPCPVASAAVHAHLAAFVRGAPAGQRDAFWQRVGEAVQARLDDRPLWLSTAGMGVAWLHVRIDDRPKYYGHAPYRKFTVNPGGAGG